jgi:hypothetical protein
MYVCVCVVSFPSRPAFAFAFAWPFSSIMLLGFRLIFLARQEWCEKERAAELVRANQKRDSSRLKSPKGVAVNVFLEIAVADMDDHCVKVYI